MTIAAIRGPEGTTVTLGIETPGQPVRDVVVERRRIDPQILPVAKTIADGTVGYLRLPSMESEVLMDGVTKALGEFRASGVDGDLY